MNNIEKLEERLRKAETKLSQVWAGGLVLLFCVLAFFGYEHWIDIPSKVSTEFDETIKEEHIKKINYAASEAEDFLVSLEKIRNSQIISDEDGNRRIIVVGKYELSGADQYNNSADKVFCEISLPQRFAETPCIFTSIKANSGSATAPSIVCSTYDSSKNSFKVVLREHDKTSTPYKKGSGLNVEWMAVCEPLSKP